MSEAAARAVLQAHIDALNAHDELAIARTLHFPHIRLSGSDLQIWDTSDTYFDDFRARAQSDWARSGVRDVQLSQAADTKVHLDAEITRFDANGALIASFRSLWIITLENGFWAAKLRSSFAKL